MSRREAEIVPHDKRCHSDSNVGQCKPLSNAVHGPQGEWCNGILVSHQIRQAVPALGDELSRTGEDAFVWEDLC